MQRLLCNVESLLFTAMRAVERQALSHGCTSLLDSISLTGKLYLTIWESERDLDVELCYGHERPHSLQDAKP